jgi:hypothetical protein
MVVQNELIHHVQIAPFTPAASIANSASKTSVEPVASRSACTAVPAEIAEPMPDPLNRGVRRIEAREARGKTESPGNGAQRLEKIESTPVNGMVS